MDELEQELRQLIGRLAIDQAKKDSFLGSLDQQGLSVELIQQVELAITQALAENQAALEREVAAGEQRLDELIKRLNEDVKTVQKMEKRMKQESSNTQDQAELDKIRKKIG